jgi:ADP-heptose:LPS heptosyltransferase
VKRVLILRLGAIGDVLMTTPTVRALKERYPDAELVYVTGKGLSPVLVGLPYLSEIIEFDKTLPGLCALASELGKRSFDLTINLQPSIKTDTRLSARPRLSCRGEHASNPLTARYRSGSLHPPHLVHDSR